jgi:predicted small lipoprotein YifL
MRRPRRLAAAISLLALALGACGKYGPPVRTPPPAEEPGPPPQQDEKEKA